MVHFYTVSFLYCLRKDTRKCSILHRSFLLEPSIPQLLHIFLIYSTFSTEILPCILPSPAKEPPIFPGNSSTFLPEVIPNRLHILVHASPVPFHYSYRTSFAKSHFHWGFPIGNKRNKMLFYINKKQQTTIS